ncbi:conjugal transfer protein TrbB [Mycobacterium avium]|uniref:conjugal transfer protein TrbB n=1 Tax=Mycobacterium avium TaxID=1764 RepID=UPI001E40F0F9|nr:conjugal transfer protein TrbB [Mycobacterium avium]
MSGDLQISDQVLLHVERNRAGRRRLSEIAVLQRVQERVRSVTVWHADRGMTEAAPLLRRVLEDRMPS